MDKSYSQMMEAYRKVYEAKGDGDGKPPAAGPGHPPHIPAVPFRGMRPVIVKKNEVSIDVTQPYVGPGEVEKAYYTYPAGFDPTGREDVAKSPSASKKVDYTEGVLDAALKADKKMGDLHKKVDNDVKRMKDGKKFKEDIEIIGDYLLEAGLVENENGVDAFYTHMSEEWKTHIVESLKQARKNVGMDPNKPSCWKGYKATGTKMKGGKKVPDCKPA